MRSLALTRLSVICCVLSTSACADILGLGDFAFGDGGNTSTSTSAGGNSAGGNSAGGSGAGVSDGGSGAGGTPIVNGGGGAGGSGGGDPNICDGSSQLTYRDLVLCDAPLLYLRFEAGGPPGVMVNELGNSVGDGTCGGAAILTEGVPGIGGDAVRVGNTRCEMSLQANDEIGFVPSAPFTVEAWVRADDAAGPSTFGYVGTWDGTKGYSLFAFPGSTASGELPNAEFKRNALPDAIQCATDPACQSALKFDTFRHLVATYDPSAQARLYIDGQLAIAAPLTNPLEASTFPFALVGPMPGNGPDQTVTFDEVAVYGRALSASEVAGHFTCGVGQGCVNTD